MQSTFKDNYTYRGLVANYKFVMPLGIYVAEIWVREDTLAFGATNIRDLVQIMRDMVDGYLLEHPDALQRASIQNQLLPEPI